MRDGGGCGYADVVMPTRCATIAHGRALTMKTHHGADATHCGGVCTNDAPRDDVVGYRYDAMCNVVGLVVGFVVTLLAVVLLRVVVVVGSGGVGCRGCLCREYGLW